MLKNYLKTAWRNIAKQKIFSVINLTGLTIGLTSCLLIALYIQNELSFDKFQENGDRIARVIMRYSFDGSSESNEGNFTSVRVAAIFPKTFPEVKAAVKMTELSEVVKYEGKLFDEKKFMYADSNFFDIFPFKLLLGNPRQVLGAPYNLVLTESTAKKYFGVSNPVGKTMQVGNEKKPYHITGVMRDFPANSQMQPDFLASFSSLELSPEYAETYWDANYTTYLLFNNKSDIDQLQLKLPAFMKKEMAGKGANINFFLEPFEKIHLYSPYDSFMPNNSIDYIYILAAVALLILIIACSTYINLSTARSLERAKEVGVRKVVGALKKQLFWQFINESTVVCLIAFVFSMSLSALLLPAFSQLTNKQLDASHLFSLPFILFSLGITLLISCLAGLYPAVVLSKFQPVKVLKGAFKNTGSGQLLRKSLIVFQFGISVFLLIATFVINRQLHFIQDKKLGYERDRVLVLPMDSKMLRNLDLIKNELKADPGVLSVSRCVRSPVEGGGGYNMRSALMPEKQEIAVIANPVDEDFAATVSLQILAGKNFSRQDILDVSRDSGAVYHFILNESAARALGWSPQDAVGKKIFLGNERPGYVSAVVRDFNFESLHAPIRPFVLFPELRARELLVKLNGGDIAKTISFLQSKWKELVPDRPFEYHFLDEDYNKLYASEQRLGKVMKLFTAMGILLACFGLFGLSSYAMQQRTKEIGIRKVLGGTIANIVSLLAKEFIFLALLAFAVASPLAWFAMNKWLQDYSYRITFDWVIFLLSGMAVVLVVILTISFQSIKAAMANPVKSLRTE